AGEERERAGAVSAPGVPVEGRVLRQDPLDEEGVRPEKAREGHSQHVGGHRGGRVPLRRRWRREGGGIGRCGGARRRGRRGGGGEDGVGGSGGDDGGEGEERGEAGQAGAAADDEQVAAWVLAGRADGQADDEDHAPQRQACRGPQTMPGTGRASYSPPVQHEQPGFGECSFGACKTEEAGSKTRRRGGETGTASQCSLTEKERRDAVVRRLFFVPSWWDALLLRGAGEWML
ncbi:unnamed protein product, partial [Ectocarpus fasciculatus]